MTLSAHDKSTITIVREFLCAHDASPSIRRAFAHVCNIIPGYADFTAESRAKAAAMRKKPARPKLSLFRKPSADEPTPEEQIKRLPPVITIRAGVDKPVLPKRGAFTDVEDAIIRQGRSLKVGDLLPFLPGRQPGEIFRRMEEIKAEDYRA